MAIIKMSVKETATVLDVRPARVRELIRTGQLRGVQSATSFRWIVSSGDVLQYLSRPRARGRPLNASYKKKRDRK